MQPAILLNSTQTYEHVGCYLTSAGLKATLRDAGVETVFEIGVNEPGIDGAQEVSRPNCNTTIVIDGDETFYGNQPNSYCILETVRRKEVRALLPNSINIGLSATSNEGSHDHARTGAKSDRSDGTSSSEERLRARERRDHGAPVEYRNQSWHSRFGAKQLEEADC